MASANWITFWSLLIIANIRLATPIEGGVDGGWYILVAGMCLVFEIVMDIRGIPK